MAEDKSAPPANRAITRSQPDLNSRPAQAILEATEHLLATTPVSELTVARIIAEAEVARGSFYFYFDSKYSVIAGLLDRFLGEIHQLTEGALGTPESGRITDMRDLMLEIVRAYRRHEPAVRAAAEHWRLHTEIEEIYLRLSDLLIQVITARIERDRAAGLVRYEGDARAMAAALMWMNERCLYVMGLPGETFFGSDDALVDALTAVWQGAIYGAPSEP